MKQNKRILEALDWVYEKSVNGFGMFDSAQELANDYLKGDGNIEEKVRSLINWQTSKSFTSGFVTNLGGIITLPVAIPANMSSVLYVQVRMIAAIAIMGGYDVKDDRVKTLVYICLTGSAVHDIIKDIGINLGSKLTKEAIKKISGEALKKINQKVGFKLLTKFGEKGILNLGKAIPVLGGGIGGSLDAYATKIIGKKARISFINWFVTKVHQVSLYIIVSKLYK